MALVVDIELLKGSESDVLEKWRDRALNWRLDEVEISDDGLTTEVLEALVEAAEAAEDTRTRRIVAAILEARNGTYGSIPNFNSAQEMFLAFLRDGMVRGWLWKAGKDGHHYPYLVTKVQNHTDREGNRSLRVEMVANGGSEERERATLSHVRTTLALSPDDLTRKTVADILTSRGYLWETEDLRQAYDAETELYRKELTEGFAQQYRYSGVPRHITWHRNTERVTGARIVHDVAPGDVKARPDRAISVLFKSDQDEDGMGDVPVHPVLLAFDLRSHEHYWVHVADVQRYEYDPNIASKLVLPDEQRELLDVLTSDIGVFTADLIEGKSAGNVILCKGVPGVGKTLSAEVYSEVVRRPLYSIHSGILGTKPDEIRGRLETAFARTKRWDAVLLLDEADVFILQRREDILQNAIVAEFLRTMEYFDGLMFMTTNRPQDVDDAIISRCAAIIDYQPPSGDDARRVWMTLAGMNSLVLSDDLLDGLVAHFPAITPREVKMLLRLVLRMAAHRDAEVSLDLFRQCAIFRGIHFEG